MAFVTGDVVRLRSGGPKMTIAVYGPYIRVQCAWFGPWWLGRKYFCEEFLSEQLEYVDG